jgi:hypothetical protein
MPGDITMLTMLLSSVAILVLVYFSNVSHFSMTERALDWLQDKAVGWSHSPVNKIDTHHHCVPPFYAKGMYTLIKDFIQDPANENSR